jgi:tryptophanyl-tRNA synthetase
MRPTGKLHIGHYFGALQNWVRLQDDPAYDCFYFIADWHALTTHYAEDTKAVPQNTIEITTDWLACGLDPSRSTIYVQSLIPEHAELHLILSMIMPLGWLERVPTYKEQIENLKEKDLNTYGFLGYPLLQAADIAMYDADFVPVGEDQVPHVELTREIARRFNFHFGFDISDALGAKGNLKLRKKLNEIVHTGAFHPGDPMPEFAWLEWKRALKKIALEIGLQNAVQELPPDLRAFYLIRDLLREPDAMLTSTPRFPGLDGRRMAKSYGNAITLSESDADIRAKTKVMVTDPARKRRTDPGNPDVCPVYDWHKLFSPPETLAWSAQGCRTAGIGCIECKAAMADNLIKWIAPIRERRLEYEKHPARVLEVIDAGSKKARAEAQQTMARVREAVFGWHKKREEVASGESRVAR